MTGTYLVSQGGTNFSWSNFPITLPPIVIPATAGTYGSSNPPGLPNPYLYGSQIYDGWFFENYKTGINIGWACPLSTLSFTTNGTPAALSLNSNSLYQGYVCFTSNTTTSSVNLVFYTQPATGGNFYKSRWTWIYNGPILANTPYIAYINFNNNIYTQPPQKLLHTPIATSVSPVGKIGNFYGEQLYYMSVSSNSIQSAFSDSFVVSEAGIIYTDGVQPVRQPFQFLGSSVQPLNAPSLLVLVGASYTPGLAQNGYTLIPAATSTFLLNSLTGGVGVLNGYALTIFCYPTAGSLTSITITYNTTSTIVITSNQSVSFSWTGNGTTGGLWAPQ